MKNCPSKAKDEKCTRGCKGFQCRYREELKADKLNQRLEQAGYNLEQLEADSPFNFPVSDL